MNFSALGSLWNNPFTTSMGAATATVGVLHALGVNLPLDPMVLMSLFSALGLFAAKDGNVTGGSVKQ
jgi:hypothetical protein